MDKHRTEQKRSVGGGDLCGFLWPLAASKVPVSHCSSKKTATRFPQPLVSWVNVQVPEHDPELGVVVRPAYLFQQVSFETHTKKSNITTTSVDDLTDSTALLHGHTQSVFAGITNDYWIPL